jgi:hypothetical protein
MNLTHTNPHPRPCPPQAHRLKNDQTLTNRALAAIQCARRVLLSGTPMQNHLDEVGGGLWLWSWLWLCVCVCVCVVREHVCM